MTAPEDGVAAQRLAGEAHDVGWAFRYERLRIALWRISGGRLANRRGWPVIPILGTPWQDVIAAERTGWRCRAAYLNGEVVFEVDYRVCRRCRLGWVEQPYTDPRYQRCGLASAGLAALRAENSGISWHTLGNHFDDAEPFWIAVGAGVRGGYERRKRCPHIEVQGPWRWTTNSRRKYEARVIEEHLRHRDAP